MARRFSIQTGVNVGMVKPFRLHRVWMFVVAVMCLAVPLPLRSQPNPSIGSVLDSLFSVQNFEEVSISPDGSRVAWVEELRGRNGSETADSAIYVASLNSPSKPLRITAGDGVTPHAEHDLAWSPDSTHLTFLSDRAMDGQLQLYVVPAGGGAAKPLTQLKGLLAEPRWAPDGKSIAFLFTENLPRSAGPLEPKAPVSGVVESHIFEQRLAVVDVATAQVRQVSPAHLYIYEYDWSPDGKDFVVSAAHGDGDNNWWIAEIFSVSVADGRTRSIVNPSTQIAVPRWSPDGKTIAFIGGLMSDQGVTGGDIYTVPAGGGEPVDITPGMKASASWIHWLSSSREILFEENIDGNTGIARVDTASHQMASMWEGAESISAAGWSVNLSLANDGKTSAFIRSSLSRPPEVWAGPIGAWKQMTHANDAQRPAWGEGKNLHWTNGGMTVQGWLIYPRHFDPQKKYPLLVSVHGGPASMKHLSWPGTFFDLTVLSAEGYFVLAPNPRGSYGQGEAYTRANVKDFGYGDLQDILAGVDEAVKSVPIDPQRVGIGGWSYGGFMTMWAVTETQRFKAAIAGAGIMNWQSYYGENGIDQWMIPFFGASVYDDPAVYAKSSPITFIKHAKTPTLVLVGDSDVECPTPQSFEFWHALKALGVKTELVIYQDEGHFIARPVHQRDIMKRTVEWLNQYLK